MRWLKKLFEKREDPEAAARELMRGVELAQRERFEEALSAYRRALELYEEFGLAYLNQALALQDLYNRDSSQLDAGDRSSRLTEIEESLERAVELEPELLVAWRHLAHVRRRLGDFIRAEQAFEHLVEVAPEDFPHLDEAKRELRHVAVLAERQRTLQHAVELAVADESEVEEMRAAVEQVEPLLIHPETPDQAFWATGVLLRRLDDLGGAREMFEACVERAPRHLDARRELATICMHAGDMGEALEHSMEAYREDPSNPALVCNVGVCYLGLDDLGSAEEFLRMARDIAPDNEIVRRAWEALEDKRPPPAAG